MKFNISGTDYELKYNNNSLFKIEETLDTPIFNVFGDENQLSKMGTMAAIVYCGLVNYNGTFEDFKNSIEISDLANVIPLIVKDVTDAFTPTKKKELKKKVQKVV